LKCPNWLLSPAGKPVAFCHAHQRISFRYNPEAPFGLESFDPELTAEGLMAEKKRRSRVLK